MKVNALPDAAARAAALQADASFIVQAPAGSGKTGLLTQRVLRLLALVEEPEEVVAITFTRKAAAEMRQRVAEALLEAAQASTEAPKDDHARLTRELAQTVLQRSAQRGWALEHSPQRLRMLTIDALCAHLVQQAPLATGFGGRARISESAEPLYQRAARATLAALEDDPAHAPALARVLVHFDNQAQRVEQQLMRLLARRDQWLALVTRGVRAARPRHVLEAGLQTLIHEHLARIDAKLNDDLRTRWLASAAHASRQRAAEPALPIHTVEQWPGDDPACLTQWRALLDLVLTAERKWRQKIDARIGFPAGKGKSEKEAFGPPREAHLALISDLQAIDGLQTLLMDIDSLPAPAYDDAQWAVLEALLDTLRLAAAQLQLVFADSGEVDFAEMAARAVMALGEADAPSDLALRLDYRIRHLLIDEFQDTSNTQWALLERLTAGWQPGDGRTLFVVGDPMQSIYRFREADVSLFTRAREHGVGLLTLIPLQLTANFRSTAGVIDWVNASFSRVFPAQADASVGAVTYAPAVAVRPSCAEHEVQLHAVTDDVEEARSVVGLVRAALARDAQGSVAVLVRSRGHLAAIAPALRDAGIRYRAVEIEGLAQRPVITDLRALAWALLHPLDRVAWLAVLRAPWCGATLDDLHALCAGLDKDASLWAAMHDPERLARLSASGRPRIEGLRTILAAAFARQGSEPLAYWLETVWLALGGPACYTPEADAAGPAIEPAIRPMIPALDDAAAFFDCLRELAPGATLDDFAQLDRALARLYASADSADDLRVSLMTIHKSKGLEFDTVILPGLGRGTRSDPPPPVLWAQVADAQADLHLVLAPVHATGAEHDPIFSYVCHLESRKQQHEAERLLYVAATRARRRLHLIAGVSLQADGQLAEPRSASLLARLWPAVCGHFQTLAADLSRDAVADASEHSRPEQAPEPPPLRRRIDWHMPTLRADLPVAGGGFRPQDAPPPFDWAGEVARLVGVVFHRWMQRIAREGISHWPATRLSQPRASVTAEVLADLRGEGVPAQQRDHAAQRILRGLENTLNDPRGRWLLDNAHEDARSEYAIHAWVGDELRQSVVDRSFIDAQGQRWIVDFKTSSHEGGDLAGFVSQERERYRSQLEGYRKVMQALDPRPIRCALYLPMLDAPALRWVALE